MRERRVSRDAPVLYARTERKVREVCLVVAGRARVIDSFFGDAKRRSLIGDR